MYGIMAQLAYNVYAYENFWIALSNAPVFNKSGYLLSC